jgi:hypothetical protein
MFDVVLCIHARFFFSAIKVPKPFPDNKEKKKLMGLVESKVHFRENQGEKIEEKREQEEKKISLDEIERIFSFFNSSDDDDDNPVGKGKIIRDEDKFLWYFFLCQQPSGTNVTIDEYNRITNVTPCRKRTTSNQLPRFVNFIYDIEWSERVTREDVGDYVRFWIPSSLFDVWDALKKITGCK